MCGGKVIGVTRLLGSPTRLYVRDNRNTDQCCVNVDEGRIQISPGDQVWWQCGTVMWTPKGNKGKHCGVDFDIQLPKIGYTYGLSHAVRGLD